MPELVCNTGPTIALTAAVGNLKFLQDLYHKILLPREVFRELEAGGADCIELEAIHHCSVIRILRDLVELPLLIRSQLDCGEASVIQRALLHNVSTWFLT